jgi:membrane protein
MSATTRWTERINQAKKQAGQLWEDVRRFPWRTTAITLRERFREDRLAVTAGSLTFTTMISLVPLFTVALAIFSAFPVFSRMETMLQKWLVQSLVPENIARQVTNYLVQFSNKAGQMGWLGALLLLGTALALILTIDRKLNDIWRVRKLRPLTQRVLVYWAVLTLGPFVLALSLSLSSYAMSASRGWVGAMHGGLLVVLDVLEFVMVIGALAGLYRYVPNARVRWPHALVGGLFVWVGLEVAKKLLAWYLVKVPTYSVVYGTFATVPILLVWIYVAWVTLLLGAVVTAYLPSLLSGIARRGDTPGWNFQLALEALDQLWTCRAAGDKGLGLVALAQRLRVDPLQLEGPMETLLALDWVGRLAEEDERYVLLVSPSETGVAPLAQQLLLPSAGSTEPFWQASHWATLRLADALPAR